MEITNKDVKVLGRVVAITEDSIVASAEQVFDDVYKQGMSQSAINSEIREWIDNVTIINTTEIDNIF